MSEYYHRWISQGKCGQCGKLNDRPDRKVCTVCAEKDKKAQTESKRFMKSMGICPICKKNAILGSENSCPECRAKAAKAAADARVKDRESYNAKMREYHRAQYLQRREQGLCTRCGKKLTDSRYSTCELCRNKSSRLISDSYTDPRQQRVENGKCYWCGMPVKQGFKVCQTHYDMNVDKARSRKRDFAC